MGVNTAVAQTQEAETNLKAAFIYNFTKYITWDNDANDNEFIIGIVGSSAIDKPITEIAKTNIAKNKRIVLKHFNKPEEISYCQVLFIPRNCPYSLEAVLDKVDKSVLTISEEPNNSNHGTAINFVLINDKLKFEISLKAMNAAGLRAGSQLLKLAIIKD